MSRPIEQEKQIKFLAERFEWRAMSSIPPGISTRPVVACILGPSTNTDTSRLQVYKSSSSVPWQVS